jgi:hypothetical protein
MAVSIADLSELSKEKQPQLIGFEKKSLHFCAFLLREALNYPFSLN